MKVSFDVELKESNETFFLILKDTESGTYFPEVGVKIASRLHSQGYKVIKKVRIPAYLCGRYRWTMMDCRLHKISSYNEVVQYIEDILFCQQEKTLSMIRNNLATENLVKLLKSDGDKK